MTPVRINWRSRSTCDLQLSPRFLHLLTFIPHPAITFKRQVYSLHCKLVNYNQNMQDQQHKSFLTSSVIPEQYFIAMLPIQHLNRGDDLASQNRQKTSTPHNYQGNRNTKCSGHARIDSRTYGNHLSCTAQTPAVKTWLHALTKSCCVKTCCLVILGPASCNKCNANHNN